MNIQAVPCDHQHHTFAHPLCANQSLLKKIMNVAFNILTLGIPLAVVYVYSCLFNRGPAPVQKPTNIAEQGVDSVKNQTPLYSPNAAAAIEFAKAQITLDVPIEPIQAGWGKAKQPIDITINQLTTLYKKAFQELEDLLKENQQDPWKHEEVLNAADKMIQIAFAASALTLEDLPAFTKALPPEDKRRAYPQALSRQDSYLYRTFFYLPTTYHYIRGAMAWGINEYTREEGLQVANGPIAPEHSDPYYQDGTRQNRWLILYNEYCRLFRKVVNEKEMDEADSRFVNWTEEDTGPESFRANADTLPT